MQGGGARGQGLTLTSWPLPSCQISEEEIERIMSGQEFDGEANISWSNTGDSDNSSPGNGVSESNQPSPVSTPSSRWGRLRCSPPACPSSGCRLQARGSGLRPSLPTSPGMGS